MARLVTVKDAHAATALEVVAGNKLFQVVVDDELTAKALLQKGSLRRRVTIIPLNKISRQVIPLGFLRDSDAAAFFVADSLEVIGHSFFFSSFFGCWECPRLE